MKARLAVIVAASAGLLTAGTAALAKQTPQNSTAPAQNGVVGNPQLKDFSLNGTTTRTAPAPTPAPSQSRQPTRTVQKPTPAPTASRPAASSNASPAAGPSRDRVAPSPSAPTAELSAPGPASELPAPTVESNPTAPDPVALAPVEEPSTSTSNTLPMLAWIVAVLALVGAAAWFVFSRRRPRESFAGAGSIDLFDEAPSPAPEPVAKPVPPSPLPAAPASQPQPAVGGVVATRLRPWLEIHFKPDRGVVDEQKAAVAFEVSVYNSGNLPARDVLLEAALFNAGAMQDQQIQLFFDNPVAKGDRIPVIPPMQSVSVNTAVFLARDQVKPIEMEGRTFFVPIVAFNALYNWGSNKAQTSMSYIVGKDTGGEKLAPFRLDLGSRIFRGLAAREHELRFRK